VTRAGTTVDLVQRLRALPAPRPMLSRDDLDRLTDRQRELLAQLGSLFRDGFADLTMSEIAARRDELVLTVVDTHLWRTGREAMAAIRPDMAPLEAVRAYLGAATVAVSGTTPAWARDLAAMPAARRRNGEHADYVVAVTRTLLDVAIERGDIADVDTAAVARTLANLGQDFIAPEVMATLRSSPKVAADGVIDIILRGLATPAPPSAPDTEGPSHARH
jgi:AcrR family transcriptional regulator